MNKVILFGNLGNDPELRQTNSGTAVANLNLATSMRWRDKNSGEQKEKTEWHRVTLWGRDAEVAGEYLRKGAQVLVEGRLETRKWQDQQGNDRYSTEVVCENFSMTRRQDGSRGPSSTGREAPATQPPPQYDDDIPF